MKANRITRVNEIIRRELATQMYRLAPRAGLEAGRVTVTHVQTAVDLRTAKVLVSVMGTPQEQEDAMGKLRRLRAEFQEALRSNVILRYTPHLQFTLDHSVEQGDRVLRLLEELGGGEEEEETRTEAQRDGDTEGEEEEGRLQLGENDGSQDDGSQSGEAE